MLIDLKPRRADLRPVSSRSKRALIPAFMSNWGLLHLHLVQAQRDSELTIDHVEQLLRIELATRKRLIVATRLLGVYHRLAREENERRLAEALGAK